MTECYTTAKQKANISNTYETPNWDVEKINSIYKKPFFQLLSDAHTVHNNNHPPTVQLSTLQSIKTGACPEDCKYCAQSGHYKTNINKENTFTLNFSETDYDLSNFSTKSVTRSKIQELNSIVLFNCLKKNIQSKNFNKNSIITDEVNELCYQRTLGSISEELYKRFILPFYIMIISLIGGSLIIEPKLRYFIKFHKLNIFLLGSFTIILAQISLKFFLNSINMTSFILLLPIILILFYYFILLIVTKFKLSFL